MPSVMHMALKSFLQETFILFPAEVTGGQQTSGQNLTECLCIIPQNVNRILMKET